MESKGMVGMLIPKVLRIIALSRQPAVINVDETQDGHRNHPLAADLVAFSR